MLKLTGAKRVARWCNNQGVGLLIKKVAISTLGRHVTTLTLGKLFTPIPLLSSIIICHRSQDPDGLGFERLTRGNGRSKNVGFVRTDDRRN